MKLPDALRRDQDGDPLDERIAAELDAIDSALRGEQVDPEMSSLATLTSDLRADREEVESDFSARLDAWAAAGFPRGERPGSSRSAKASGSGAGGVIDRLRARFASTPPRRLIGPGFAAASVAVIAAVAISQSGDIGGSDDSSGNPGGAPTAVIQEQTTASPSTADQSGDVEVPDAAAGDAAVPAAPESAGSAGAGSAGGASSDSLAPATPAAKNAAPPAVGRTFHYLKGSQGFATQSARGIDLNQIRKNRKVERDAQLGLKADPKDVPDVAARASDVTERFDGHVLSSQVSGTPESAEAHLQLAIPSKNLDAAISDLSDLAEVSSRSENAQDITRSFVTARDQLAGFRAERDSLLARLADATTDEETDDLKARLSIVNDEIARARGSVDKLNNRAAISQVSLDVSSDGMIGSPGDDSDDDSWGIGDALHDAGHVLTVAGGVILISAAILVPLAIVALIAFLILRGTRTRARERTLDD